MAALPPQFWLWAGVVIAAIIVIYYKVEQGKLEAKKGAVMAKQRAIAQSLGPKILPFRDKIEGWVEELAHPFPGELVSEGATLAGLEKSGGVYLRLRLSDASDPAAIRKSSLRSLHDGFTSCFFRIPGGQDPSKGPACQSLADCQPGMLCNEFNVCAPPPEPYNMRLAYRSLRVLSSGWTDELHEASSDLAIAAYERDLDRVTKEDVPVAASILARSKFFFAVLDEDPAEGIPPDGSDAGESEAERVQRAPHFARIGIWDLRSGQILARLRRRAEGRFVPVGDAVINRAETVSAQQRNANSCALALSVRDALTPKATADGGVGTDSEPGVSDGGAASRADAASSPDAGAD